jgi:hypothetical protein
LKTLELLLNKGSDANARTTGSSGKIVGGSVMYWALQFWDPDHEVINLLKSFGAKFIAPGQPSPDHDEL